MADFLVLRYEPTVPTTWKAEAIITDLKADQGDQAIQRVVGPPMVPDRISVERWRAVRWDNATELVPVVTLKPPPAEG